MGGNENMVKRIFLIMLTLQVLFIGICYANSDRLADIGAEVFRERMVGDVYLYVSELEINKSLGSVEELFPGTTAYSFYLVNYMNTNNVVSISVLVNQEGYIYSIIVVGSGASESNRTFTSNIVDESMRVIGLSNEDIDWLTTKGTQGDMYQRRDMYQGEVLSVSARRKVYYTSWTEPDAVRINLIDKISFVDRSSNLL